MSKNQNAQKPEVTTEVPVAEEKKVYNVAELMVVHKTKSGVIRYLAGEKLSTADITKTMKTVFPNFIYQHARNVLNQPLKKVS